MRTQQQLPVYFFVKRYLLANQVFMMYLEFLGLSMGFVIKLEAYWLSRHICLFIMHKSRVLFSTWGFSKEEIYIFDSYI